MKIIDRKVGEGHPPLIVAEMSGNHNQSLERALEIVRAAARAGAHALKIQTYTADTMTLNISDGEFFISDPMSLWKGRTLYELYQEAYTPWEWHQPIFELASSLGMIAFSTPFDESAVEFLERLATPCYKIASFENIDLPLIRRVAQTGKPMIISTGMAALNELEESVATARESGCRDLVLLKCTSSYPASPLNTNLRTLADLRERFGCEVGLSDHTMGIGVAVASVSFGACLIEKHFTLSRADGGVDSDFSLEPPEMHTLVEETHRAWQGLGHISYGATASEEQNKVFRRSIYVTKDLIPGDILGPDNIRVIRPGFGLAPRFFDQLIGRVVCKEARRGTAMSWDLLR